MAVFKDLIVNAQPFPSYPGSVSFPMKVLRPIICTAPVVYQKATLSTKMVLSNNAEAPMGTKVSYTLGAVGIVTQSAGKVAPVAGADGKVAVTAVFTGSFTPATVRSSVAWEFTVSQTKRRITSIDNARLISQGKSVTTFSGEKGAQKGQIAFGVTLDDNTQYTQAVNNNGDPLLPGTFAYRSGASTITVDTSKGVATLQNNDAASIGLTVDAMVCDSKISQKLGNVFANLEPAITGDVDLGSKTGAALPACRKGATISVPIRVNTGGKDLAGFEVHVAYDPALLKYQRYTGDIKISNGNNKPTYTVSDNEDGNMRYVQVVCTIENSQIKGSQQAAASLATLSFECAGGGAGTLGGKVYELVQAGTNVKFGQGRPTKPFAFVAGALPLVVTGGRRSMRSLADYGPPRPRAARQASGASVPKLWSRYDANCDGIVSVSDANIIADYVKLGRDDSAEWNSFEQQLSSCNIKWDTERQSSYDSKLDVNQDKRITFADVIFLQNVLVGYAYFFELTVTPPSRETCDTIVDVRLQGVRADATVDPFKVGVYLDVATEAPNTAVAAALNSSGSLITADKGSSELYGGLVNTEAGAGGDAQVFRFRLPTPGAGMVDGTEVSFTPLTVKDKSVNTAQQWTPTNYQWLQVNEYATAPRRDSDQDIQGQAPIHHGLVPRLPGVHQGRAGLFPAGPTTVSPALYAGCAPRRVWARHSRYVRRPQTNPAGPGCNR